MATSISPYTAIKCGDLDTDAHLLLIHNIARLTKFLGCRAPEVLHPSACSQYMPGLLWHSRCMRRSIPCIGHRCEARRSGAARGRLCGHGWKRACQFVLLASCPETISESPCLGTFLGFIRARVRSVFSIVIVKCFHSPRDR